MAREFGAGRFVSRCSERDDSAAQNHLAGCKVAPLPAITAGPLLARAQSECLIRVMIQRFGSSPPPCTTGSIKGQVAGLSVGSVPVCVPAHVPVCSLLLVHARPAHSPADSALLHHLIAGSTHSPDHVCHSAHLLLTPPFSTHSLLVPPKVPPSHLTVAPHSLDRRLSA